MHLLLSQKKSCKGWNHQEGIYDRSRLARR